MGYRGKLTHVPCQIKMKEIMFVKRQHHLCMNYNIILNKTLKSNLSNFNAVFEN